MSSKTLALIMLASASLLSGVIDQYFYPGQELPPTAIGFMVTAAFLIFWWYRLDSIQLGYRRSPLLNVGVVALPIVALPYYFFRTRGAKRGAVYSFVTLIVFIFLGVLSVAGAYAAYYGLQA